jgi:hypothetical protein
MVQVEPATFIDVVKRSPAPIVVTTRLTLGLAFILQRLSRIRHHYLTPYKGLVFYAVTKGALDLPPGVEVVQAKSLFLPPFRA